VGGRDGLEAHLKVLKDAMFSGGGAEQWEEGMDYLKGRMVARRVGLPWNSGPRCPSRLIV